MKENFKLIEGVFSAKEAKEILLTLIGEKIKFHELKSFSDEVKIGRKNQGSLSKIEELKTTRFNLVAFLKGSEISDENFLVHAFIEIEKVI
ncbi:hypothetical protein [Pedobacter sp. UYEF25]